MFIIDIGIDGGFGGLVGGLFYVGIDFLRLGGFGGNYWYIIVRNLKFFFMFIVRLVLVIKRGCF